MASREMNKLKLSKSILEMKFMKRTKEKVEKQLYQEEGEEYFGSALTTRMKNASGRFIIEPSYMFCEQLRDGRVSYQGMNLEIEKLMDLEESAKLAKTQPKREAEISDEQMAKRWKPSEITSMENKFKTKRQRRHDRQRVNKKCKFLKPKD
ncbi:M-phase phosphoprotein 6 [Venturia canescens]|uniref:M-phase phosphoprotein 6 n=1 Tax=Venturia canescens TaxID=32260 RepID=UPI001C9C2AE9|nr:M-phase phosphoprotein 6 [Venturia canescens]